MQGGRARPDVGLTALEAAARQGSLDAGAAAADPARRSCWPCRTASSRCSAGDPGPGRDLDQPGHRQDRQGRPSTSSDEPAQLGRPRRSTRSRRRVQVPSVELAGAEVRAQGRLSRLDARTSDSPHPQEG
ncbi:MAG: hypothetical protein MZV70_66740 [Desulfobacterales bacterium]|nr:hypothetical protein [Desulfobacterales bacterium]